MAERIIDTLITRWGHKVDNRPLEGLERRVDAVRKKMDTLGSGMTRAGAALTAAVTGMAVPILNFETQMNNLQAVLNASGEDMDALRGQAKELGRTTAFSASQAAGAQTELAKAGFSTKEVIAALPGVLELAAAGQISLEEAAAITTSTLAAFNLPAEESGRVADVLAKAAASAKTDVSQMGMAFREAAPMANNLGVPLESVAAMLATLQDNGLRASTAGVGVRNMMVRLLKPTKDVKDTLKGMGISVDEVTDLLNQGKLAELIQLLADKNMTAEQATRLFGAESANVALILTGNTGRVDELTEALENAEGEAKRMADTQMQGLPGAVKEMQSAVEGAILAIGDAGLTKALENAADKVRDLAAWFTELDPVVLTAVATVLTMGPALIGAGVAMKFMSVALGGLVPMLKTLRWLALAVTGPFGLAAAIIAGAAYMVWKHWDGVVEFFEDVWQGIKEAFPETAAFFEGLWAKAAMPVEGMFDWVTTAWDAAVAWMSGPQEGQDVFAWLSQPVQGLFQWVTDAWATTVAALTGDFDFSAIGTGIGTDIGNAIPAALTLMTSLGQMVVDSLMGVDFTLIGTSVGAALGDAIPAALTLMTSLGQMVVDSLMGVDFTLIGTSVGAALGDAIPAALTLMTSLGQMVVDSLMGVDFTLIGTSVGAALGDAIPAALTLMTSLGQMVVDKLMDVDYATYANEIGDLIMTVLISSIRFVTGLGYAFIDAFMAVDLASVGRLIGSLIMLSAVAIFRSIPGLLDAFTEGVGKIDWNSVGRMIGKAIKAAVMLPFKIAGLIAGLRDSMADETGQINWSELGLDIGLSLLRGIGAIFRGIGDLLLGIVTEAFTGIDWLGFVPEWAREWIPGLGSDEPSGPELAVAGARARPMTLDERLAEQEASARASLAAPSRPGSRAPINRTTTTNVQVETLNVNVPSGDPDVIAAGVQGAISDQYRNAAEDHDAGYAR